MIEADNSNVEGGFMSLNLMLSKFTVICFCEAQIVLFQSFICITSVIFCLITHVVVTSSFWLCLKFCVDKIATSFVFEGYLHNLSRPCRSGPIGCPKKCLKTQIFSSTVRASLLFSAVCFLLNSAADEVDNMFVIFSVFVSVIR